LPEDHIALYAYYTGARAASDSCSLTHLLTDRIDLVDRLMTARTEADGRVWARSPGHSFPDWAKTAR
jgi:hypothetical protein